MTHSCYHLSIQVLKTSKDFQDSAFQNGTWSSWSTRERYHVDVSHDFQWFFLANIIILEVATMKRIQSACAAYELWTSWSLILSRLKYIFLKTKWWWSLWPSACQCKLPVGKIFPLHYTKISGWNNWFKAQPGANWIMNLGVQRPLSANWSVFIEEEPHWRASMMCKL